MDRLDALLGTAAPLMRRVDQVLTTAGAPPGHRVWPALRRVRLLPWDAVQAVAALRPDELAEAAPELRDDARSYAGIVHSLPARDVWSGEAADAYEAARKRTADLLSGGPDSLDERLVATADLADALSDWMRESRGAVAAALAEVLSSAEALSLVSDQPVDPADTSTAGAAADVAVRILETVADSYDAAQDLMSGSADLTNPRRV